VENLLEAVKLKIYFWLAFVCQTFKSINQKPEWLSTLKVHFHLNEKHLIIFNLTGISGKYARNSNIQNTFIVGLRLPNNQIDKP